jgi:hypothetical protein
MSLRIRILIGVLAAIFLIYSVYTWGKFFRSLSPEECRDLHSQIMEKIADANYCKQDEDCTVLKELGCSFSCWEIVNRNEVNTIKEMIENYYNKGCGIPVCKRLCTKPPEIINCEKGICTTGSQ